jgi:hypothetical protein
MKGTTDAFNKINEMDALDLCKYISTMLEGMGLNMPGESWGSIAKTIEKAHPELAKLLKAADKRVRELE